MNFNLVSDIKVTMRYNHEQFDPIKHVSSIKRVFNIQATTFYDRDAM